MAQPDTFRHDVPLRDQIRCVERELKQRARVYDRLVDAGRMTTFKRESELRAMRAVLASLNHLLDLAEPGLLPPP